MIFVNQKALLLCLSVFFFSCTAQKQVRQSATQQKLINDTALTNAFIGIAVYDTDTKQFIHQYNSNKYFVPASNTKIPTLYAGLKYLGEKLPGIQYKEQNDTLYLQATGDPTFLHIDYKQHPVFDFLKQQNKPMVMNNHNWKTEALGFGWAWDDYASYYMTERSPMPVYGNSLTVIATTKWLWPTAPLPNFRPMKL